ncbi:MAG: VOC family protein, partial [Deinococcota bacterium]
VPLERDVTPSSYLHIRVDTSLDSLYEDYLARGVEVAAAPEDKPWGMREFAVRDVNGHVLVFATHI